jgi:hypothetical protein
VDLHDVVLHVMLPRVREFYSLERMWESDTPPAIKAVTPVGGSAPKAGGAPKKTPRKSAPRKRVN